MFRKIKLVNNVETLLNIYNPKGGGGWRATIRMEKHFINDTSGSHFHVDPSRGNLLLLCRFPSDIFYLYFVLNQSWKVIYWKICKLNFFSPPMIRLGSELSFQKAYVEWMLLFTFPYIPSVLRWWRSGEQDSIRLWADENGGEGDGDVDKLCDIGDRIDEPCEMFFFFIMYSI